MHDLTNVSIPPVTDYKTFEMMCRDLYRAMPSCITASTYGRPGQVQNGVDVFAIMETADNFLGIQCKVKSGNTQMSENEIKTEIEKAKKFSPPLKKFIIHTTNKQDARTQSIVAKINSNDKPPFLFEFFFWSDVEELLKRNITILHAYYPQFFIRDSTLGYSTGKLFTLSINGSAHELMLTYIPQIEKDNHYGLNYHRDIYYLTVLNSTEIAKISERGYHYSDMKSLKRISGIDKLYIEDWLKTNKFKWKENIIFSLEFEFSHKVSEEQRLKWAAFVKNEKEEEEDE